ncbi:hypothetical protein JCGZ_08682 [Jatropha curcas]|uniref:J domain-containing protein n=1 Tax=Jatropha curcas TaxID=180498 RepID=A0A067KN33_JATCU|nr:hypothetical protein JCGZ_08682 [Jatropha curcas]
MFESRTGQSIMDMTKVAAEKARDMADEFFKLQNIDMAIKHLMAAKYFNPELPHIDDYFTAYRVHQLAANKKNCWYEILAIKDFNVDADTIKNHYRRMALMVHPDKNPSVAAEGAFKLIKSALDVLGNPVRRKAYDATISSESRSNPSKTTFATPNTGSPSTSGASSSSRKRASSSWGHIHIDPVSPSPSKSNPSKVTVVRCKNGKMQIRCFYLNAGEVGLIH